MNLAKGRNIALFLRDSVAIIHDTIQMSTITYTQIQITNRVNPLLQVKINKRKNLSYKRGELRFLEITFLSWCSNQKNY